MKCVICNSGDLKSTCELYDDRYGYTEKFSLIFCSDCGHGMLDFRPDDKELEELYTNYYPRLEFDPEKHGPIQAGSSRFRSWLNGEYANAYKWVPENVRILDIGCGFGRTLGYHTRRGCEVRGVEADSNAKLASEKFNYDIDIGVFNKDNYKQDYYDYITMDQVIEHFRDPVQSIRDASEILKPDGEIIISTPNYQSLTNRLLGKKWLHWHVPYHLHFFSRKSIQLLANETEHELIACNTITNYSWLVMQLMHLVFYPDQAQASCYWKNQSQDLQLPYGSRFLIFMVRVLAKLRLIHVANKAFDLCGRGDNYIFVLRKRTEKIFA